MRTRISAAWPKSIASTRHGRTGALSVALVKKARELGVWIIHFTEGYTSDYRELDPTNPGGFHRFGILGQAFNTGTPEAAPYPPLNPGPNDKDLFLAPRIQTLAFGGTGLNEILRSRGIKNIAVAGFTTDVCDYATVMNGYDLGYVYALKDSMAGWNQPLSEMMLNSVYTLWSTLLSNDDFIAMVSAVKKVSRQPLSSSRDLRGADAIRRTRKARSATAVAPTGRVLPGAALTRATDRPLIVEPP